MGLDVLLITYATARVPDVVLTNTVFETMSICSGSSVFGWEQVLSSDIVFLIRQAWALCDKLVPDTLFWGLTAFGCFDLRSAYTLLACPSSSNSCWWRSVWRWLGPERVRYFL